MKTMLFPLRLTPPTKYAFYSSIVMAVLACVFYLASVFGGLADGFHFAFWIAIAAWLLLAVGVAARGI